MLGKAGRHSKARKLPRGHVAGQSKQGVLPDVSLNLPVSHVEQIRLTDAEGGADSSFPTGQFEALLQKFFPVSSWYLPLGHVVQEPAFRVVLNFPTGHSASKINTHFQNKMTYVGTCD